MDMDSAMSSSPVCEDIWKKFDEFLLTPPQSPPVKMDNFDACGTSDLMLDVDSLMALDNFLESSLTDSALAEVLDVFDPMVDTDGVRQDCMWSGQGLEDSLCMVNATNGGNGSSKFRSETPLLGSSPMTIAAFGDMLATCADMDISEMVESASAAIEEEDDTNTQESIESTCSASSGDSVFVSSTPESLINDHSYGSSKSNSLSSGTICITTSSSPKPSSKQPMQSLIYPSPSYRKVLTRSRSGLKTRKIEKESSLVAPQISVKFVKRSPGILKEGSSLGKKPVKPCKSAAAKKSLGSCLSQLSFTSSPSSSTSSSSPIASMATTIATTTPCPVDAKPISISPPCFVSSASGRSSPCSTSPFSPSATSTCSLSSNFSTSSSSSSPAKKVNSSQRNSTSSNVSCSSSSTSGKQSGSGKQSMYPERRREHNDSERKRRDHLREAFHSLRDQVPKLKETTKKPARITILHEASCFVSTLIEKHRSLEKMKEQEMERREKLIKKLAMLKAESSLNKSVTTW